MKSLVLMVVIMILLSSGSAGVMAQDRPNFVPITPENADQVVQIAQVEYAGVNYVSWSQDGKTLLAMNYGKSGVWLYDALDLEVKPRLFVDETQWTLNAVFSPDGTLIATDSEPDIGARQICLWDVVTGELLRAFGYHSEGDRSLALSPDGSLIASNDGYRGIFLWNVATGKLVASEESPGWIPSQGPYIVKLDYSPDGTMIAFTAEWDDVDSIVIWDVTPEPQPIWDWLVVEKDIDFGQIAFSPDSTQLAVDERSSVRLIDVATGETIRRFGSGLGEGFWHIAFSPDGAILATGGPDHMIRLWDVMTGETLMLLADHTDRVSWVEFSPDGTQLVSAGFDDTIRLWGIPVQE